MNSSREEGFERFVREVRGLLEVWWKATHGESPMPTFKADDNLFDLGLVDSLRFIELIEVAERFSGVTIDLVSEDPSALMNLSGLYEIMYRGTVR